MTDMSKDLIQQVMILWSGQTSYFTRNTLYVKPALRSAQNQFLDGINTETLCYTVIKKSHDLRTKMPLINQEKFAKKIFSSNFELG